MSELQDLNWEEIVVEKRVEKEGASNGKPWKRIAIKDGNGEWISTFDESLVPADAEGKRARIKSSSTTRDGRVLRNLLVFELVTTTNGSLPESYSHQKVDGEADWDKVALGKTRCALWNHYLSGHLAANLYAKAVAEQQKAPGATPRDPMDYVIITGTRLVVHAEKDIFERPAGDDGIPFKEDGFV